MIIRYLFLPFLLYFMIFVMYVTYFHPKQVENGHGNFEKFGLANTLSIIFLSVFIAYFTFLEFIQLIMFQGIDYFKSLWNIFDWISLLTNATILIMDIANTPEADFNSVSGVAVIFLYLRLFYFGRIFLQTTAMVRMVLEIVYDMRFFLLFLLVAIAGFGNAYLILARNLDEGALLIEDNYWYAFIYAYNQALGNFDTDAYTGPEKHLLFFIWFLNSIITLVIFLNLLIAIMGDTFDRVQDNLKNNTTQGLLQIMVDNELLMRDSSFKIKLVRYSSNHCYRVMENQAL